METTQKLNTILCTKYENDGLKNAHILSKIISLQCSWLKQLYDSSSPPWRIIPSYLTDTYLGKNFKLHSNLDKPANKKVFPYTISKHLRDGVKIYLHFLVFPRLLCLKLFAVINTLK